MDNLTHSLVGLGLARAGLGKRVPGATALLIVAANLPDVDSVAAAAAGRLAYLHHHRGLSHSIVGVAVLGLLLGLAAALGARAAGRPARTATYVGLSLAAIATHPLLDLANSYGLRPFLPWDGRWIYGDALFIVDPWLWLVLGGSLLLSRRRGRRWALAGLAATAAYALVLRGLGAAAHARAAGAAPGGSILATLPQPLDPLRWTVVARREGSGGGEVGTGTVDLQRRAPLQLSWRPTSLELPAVRAALATPAGRVLREFYRYPFADVRDEARGFEVRLHDARFSSLRSSDGFASARFVLDRGLVPIETPGGAGPGAAGP